MYSLDSVLNLSPFNTRILFYNVKDLNHSRLSCSDSLTNKLGDYFKFDLCKGDFNLANLPGLNIHVEDKCKDYAAKVLQNNKLNVVKGFILDIISVFPNLYPLIVLSYSKFRKESMILSQLSK